MKPTTRRIWIFVGLKLKEIGIVLAWIAGIIFVGVGIYKGLEWALENNNIHWVFIFMGILLTSLFYIGIIHPMTCIWIKSNWRKAGQIERKTRKKK